MIYLALTLWPCLLAALALGGLTGYVLARDLGAGRGGSAP